ncbi:hypothetical protein D3C86_1564900 [compost metagenome]
MHIHLPRGVVEVFGFAAVEVLFLVTDADFTGGFGGDIPDGTGEYGIGITAALAVGLQVIKVGVVVFQQAAGVTAGAVVPGAGD